MDKANETQYLHILAASRMTKTETPCTLFQGTI